MAHLIDKDTLVAEIERQISAIDNCPKLTDTQIAVLEGDKVVLTKLLSFINSLEVKEVDLKEKATQLSQKHFPDEENILARPNIEAQRCKSACIEMVEWLKAQKGE